MARQYFREESKLDWYQESEEKLSTERLQLGCLMRIANSIENMEKPYLKLLSDLDYCHRRIRELCDENDHLLRSNAAYRGIVNKRKKGKK